MFRSYIFVRTTLKNALFLLKTSGVVKIVKFGAGFFMLRNISLLEKELLNNI